MLAGLFECFAVSTVKLGIIFCLLLVLNFITFYCLDFVGELFVVLGGVVGTLGFWEVWGLGWFFRDVEFGGLLVCGFFVTDRG